MADTAAQPEATGLVLVVGAGTIAAIIAALAYVYRKTRKPPEA